MNARSVCSHISSPTLSRPLQFWHAHFCLQHTRRDLTGSNSMIIQGGQAHSPDLSFSGRGGRSIDRSRMVARSVGQSHGGSVARSVGRSLVVAVMVINVGGPKVTWSQSPIPRTSFQPFPSLPALAFSPFPSLSLSPLAFPFPCFPPLLHIVPVSSFVPSRCSPCRSRSFSFLPFPLHSFAYLLSFPPFHYLPFLPILSPMLLVPFLTLLVHDVLFHLSPRTHWQSRGPVGLATLVASHNAHVPSS